MDSSPQRAVMKVKTLLVKVQAKAKRYEECKTDASCWHRLGNCNSMQTEQASPYAITDA